MGASSLCVFLIVVLLPSVVPTVCPDSSTCPGEDVCCPSGAGYNCCPVVGGVCCMDGAGCCEHGYICIPGIGLCLLPPPSQIDTDKKTVRPAVSRKETSVAQSGICPFGSTWCAGSAPEGDCCLSPDAVCCSDKLHCCPKGYTCDLTKEICIKDSNRSSKFLQLPVTDPKLMTCPDGNQCPANNTCCKQQGGYYGCCEYIDGVCCSDKIHCCPSSATCDIKRQVCLRQTDMIPRTNKIPVIRRKQTNNAILL